MLGSVELFSLLGFPARVAGRALLAFRYVSSHGSSAPLINEYAVQRFGKDVKWRPWLMIDVKELEETEKLINFGTDAQVENWRVSKLSVCGMIAIIVRTEILHGYRTSGRLTTYRARSWLPLVLRHSNCLALKTAIMSLAEASSCP